MGVVLQLPETPNDVTSLQRLGPDVRGYAQIREDEKGRCTMVEVATARRNEAGDAPDEL